MEYGNPCYHCYNGAKHLENACEDVKCKFRNEAWAKRCETFSFTKEDLQKIFKDRLNAIKIEKHCLQSSLENLDEYVEETLWKVE